MSRPNSEHSAMPFVVPPEHSGWEDGLTKREYFCLHMRVAKTGDPELDEIIREGVRQDFAKAAMQGCLACADEDGKAYDSRYHADKMIEELEKTQ